MYNDAPTELLEIDTPASENDRDGVDAGLYNFVLEYYNSKDENSTFYSYASLRKCWHMMDKISSSSDIEPGLNTQAKLARQRK